MNGLGLKFSFAAFLFVAFALPSNGFVLAATPPVGAPQPGVLAQPPRYNAPTPSLTAVANGMALKLKSLNMLITTAPNLPITQGVEISIAYFSPNAAPFRTNQSYVRSTGNRFLFVDSERDGKPRQVRFDISLAERSADGKLIPFGFSWQVTLDPLYDVDIGGLRFELLDDCDAVRNAGMGKSEIKLFISKPDLTHVQAEFSLFPGNYRDIKEFSWFRKEISASANLLMPRMRFYEKDSLPAFQYMPGGFGTDGYPLIPGRTRADRVVQKVEGGNCRARFVYQINYNLRRYPYL